MVNPAVALLARLLGFSFGKSKAPIHLPKPPSGRLWRDLIIAKTGRAQTPTVAPASGARQRHAGSCAGTVLLTEEKNGKISVVAWENYPQGTFRPAPRGS